MRRALLGGLALALAACEAPPVFPGADQRQNTSLSRIEGTVIVTGPERGNVVVLLYAAQRPPPPDGTGRPVNFTVLTERDVYGAAAPGATGPFTAPFSFSLVPPGSYVVRGFVDSNKDWNPWLGVTSEVNAGDVGGAALDAVTRAPVVVHIDVVDGGLTAVEGVAVSFSPTARVPVDRPVFAAGPSPVRVAQAPVALTLTVEPLPGPVVTQPAPVFLTALVDANGDGAPDDTNGDGIPELWPRVVVRKLADDGSLADENDLDRNGILDTEAGFADYEHVSPGTGASIPADGKPDAVVLAAGFNVAALLPQLVNEDGGVKAAPTPLTSLPLVIQPRAVDASQSPPGVLKVVPPGRYAITVIQSTGQTWRLPNELALDRADAGTGLTPVESQGLVVLVE